MTDNNQTNIEYLITKVFLYKYTPPFVPVETPNPSSSVPALASFDAYATTLNDTLYFTKYDISPFVVSYSVNQNIDETSYSWNIELQDLALSFSTIDTKLKVPAPEGGKTTGLSFSTSTDSITRLAVYEANSDTLADITLPIDNIISAKKNRGKGHAGLTVQNPALTNVLPQIPGLRLSDLIQEYDFISVYIYKNTTPITDVVGTFTVDKIVNNPLPIFEQSPSTVLSTNNGLSPDDPHFKYETVLSSSMLNGQPFFTNDLNGFVTKKTPVRAINQVDRIMLSGNGWSRLFGCTRRLIKPSFLTGALYQQGQLLNAKAVSGFQTVFAGKPLSSIVRDLFDLVFRIDFGDINTINGITTLDNSFYNISSLIVGNTYPANLFNIPQYLLSCVMKRRAFEYREPQDITNFALTAPSQISSQVGFTTAHLGIPPEQFQSALVSIPGQISLSNGFAPVIFNKDVQGLQAYFKFLDSVFTTKFSPDLKTPHEILEEIRKITFIEIFETSYGQFLIRAPQYNNTLIFDPKGEQTENNRIDVSMVRSSNLNIISNTYSETTDNLITKLFTGFSINGLPVVSNLEQFGYCDGKLLDQFGLIESSTVANPNINLKKSPESSINANKTNGLFEYCRYLLRILNARLKNLTVVCDFDPSIHVGYTFLDETNYRFGYISSMSKQISVTGTATMTLGITYVRDVEFKLGQDNSIVALNVEQLPVLADLERKFGGK